MKRRCETFALSFKPYQKDPTSELKVDLLKTLENFQHVVSMGISVILIQEFKQCTSF